MLTVALLALVLSLLLMSMHFMPSVLLMVEHPVRVTQAIVKAQLARFI